MAVFEKVQDIIVDELGKEKEEVTLETSFEELDADSLDLFQIINDIEAIAICYHRAKCHAGSAALCRSR